MTKRIKVLVVDDSAFMRLLLTNLLSEDRELEVVASAADGKEAVEKAIELIPDIILMDMNMGEYGGLYAVANIMQKRPIPILILSSVGNTNLDPIFDALEMGAVDYINKPKRGGSKIREMEYELVTQVKRAAQAKPRTTKIIADGLNQLTHTFDDRSKFSMIAIGASTGGPTAVEKVVTSLPANLNVPVLVCQHMPANFIPSFTERLNGLSPLNVVVGRRGMIPKPGMIIVAPGNTNMIVVRKDNTVKIDFTDKVYKEYNNPSINAMMVSVAECYESSTIGVILTGMGKDGVNGMKSIKAKGGMTIAQDEASCVIYGMPKVAFESGAVDTVLHIREIGGYLVNSL